MATSLSPTLTNEDFKNWLKGALAILFAKEGISDFVSTEISTCHKSLLQLVPTASVHTSCSCTINSLPKCISYRRHQHSIATSSNTQLCSRGVCHVLMDGICLNHRFRGPSWKNTDPQKWCTDLYEIAKCYMPPDGYANKSSMAETDFNGTVAVIINNKSFQAKFQAVLDTEPNICTKARDVGRAIRHTSDHLLSDSDLHSYIDDLINLLCDPAHLLNDPNAQVAVGKLKQLKANTLTISEHDITEVLNENIRETFSEQQKQYLQAIQNHFSQLQTDSIAELDRLVSIKKGELEDFTDKKKEEITKQVEAQTHTFSVKKTELEEFTSKKKEEITKQVEAQTHIFSVKKTELEEFTSKKKEEITKQVEAQTQEFSVKKTELEELTSKKKEEITKHVEEQTNYFSIKKTELEEFTSKTKEEINKHVEDQTLDYSVKKTELDEYTSKKKEEITKHVEAQTHDFSVKKTELEDFTSKQKENITRHVDKKTHEIESRVLYQREKQVMSDGDKQEALRDDLITYYRKNESTMPFYPLVEENDVQLMDFYVRPPISVMEKSHIFNSSKIKEQSSFHQEGDNKYYPEKQYNIAPQGTNVCSYSELFFQENSEPFINIYVIADAGMGKTALSQHITMHWCQSHKPDVLPCDKYKHDDIETMKHFKFVFLLHLRDVHGYQTCDLDDLIYDLCIKELSRKSLYSKELLENVLHNQRCLVILDGLDEWAHPNKCRKTPMVPHHNHPHTCTVLTTTRPWKLCTIGLSSTHIDRQAVIRELDYERSEELTQNAFKILTRIPSATAKCIEDFNTAVASVGDICNNPYIKLHLMCLWYEGDTIGKSRCEIYSNITELTLKRGLKKRNLSSIKALQSGLKQALPKCFEKSNKSRKHIHLLYKLGKLAFFSLYSEIKETMLIIDSETVLKYLNNREQQFCLKVGLLCQKKEVNQLVKICHKVYFQHKSIQEFFSALYIQWDWGNTLVPSTILKVCNSLPDVLEMSDVFVFICGLNPEVYSDLFKHIQAVIEKDQITCSYRTLIPYQEHNIRAYQSMQVSCIDENIKNKNGECLVSIQDIFLDDLIYNPQLLVQATSGQIKSCYFSNSWENFLKIIMTTQTRLENRTDENAIDECTIENVISRFEQNIAVNVQTLRIHSVLIKNLRSSSVSNFLSGSAEVLKYLSIYNITVSSDDLELFNACLCKSNILECIHLDRICIRDRFLDSRPNNADNSTCIVLDLPLHSQLQTLIMSRIPYREILLQAEMLHHCELGDFSLLHDSIYKLIASIGSGKLLNKITLHTIKCLDHPYDCPGVPLTMCQGSQLRTLDLNGLNLGVIDLSQSHHLQKIDLTNSSTLYELCINSEHLEICKLQLGTSLPHKCIKQIFSSIDLGKKLEELSLSTDLCLDHPIRCPSVKLNLSKHCNLRSLFLSQVQVHTLELAEGNKLQILSLFSVPINKIDLSRSNHLRTIDLRDIPLLELTINTESLAYCTLETELLLLSHDAINKLLNFIGSGSMLEQLTLKNIQCLDHSQCPGVPLTFCNNSKIRQINLCSVPISGLGFVQSRQVNTIMLKEIPLREFYTNTIFFNLSTFEAKLSVKLPHTNISQLLCFIGSCMMLRQLTLKQIQCSDHEDSCPGVPLTFCKDNQIQQLTFSRLSIDVLDLSQTCQVEKILLQNTSLCELYTSTKFLKACTLEAEFSVVLPHAIIHTFLCSIGNCMVLSIITLKELQCLEHSNCTGFPLIFCSNSMLQQLTVFRIHLNVLDLSKSNQLQMIKLQNVPLCDLQISTECLNLCTLEVDMSVNSKLSHTAISQLMCSIGSSLKLRDIKLTQIHCLDHPSCLGAPLTFCKNSQLQQLFVDKVPLSVLDLSQAVRVMMIDLRNVPLCELHTSTKSLQSCTLQAKLSADLPHTTIQQLLCSIGGCKMLTDITLTQIKCLDHADKCPGTKMIFCKDSQLQQLTVQKVPLRVLELSQTGLVKTTMMSNIPLQEFQTSCEVLQTCIHQTSISQASNVKTIMLYNIPLCELHTSAEVLQTCILQTGMLENLSHNNLQQLFHSIEGCKALTEINMQYIKCSDHSKNCPGVPLTFCENSQLRHISMCDVPLSVLDLSKTSHVKTISLRDIPLRQLHSNTKWLNLCTLDVELSDDLPHTSIEELLCSIGRSVMFSKIALKHIQCSDRPNSCPGVPLTFCKNSKLQKLTAISVPLSVLDLPQTGQVNSIKLQEMPLRELHTISDCLQECILEVGLSFTLSHNIIQQLFSSIGSFMTLSNLTVTDILCSDHDYDCLGVPLTFCKNSQLQQLSVNHVPISVLDLSEAGQVKKIKIQKTHLCEINTNTECLHSCTLEVDLSVKLSHNSIHQLFSSIGKCNMLSDITLEQIQCSDHPCRCSNVPLIFCKNSKLQHLNLFEVPIGVLDISQSDQVETIKLENIPLCEVHMNNESHQLCTMDASLLATFSHNQIEQLLRSIGSCKMLTHITLKDIKCPDHPNSCPGAPLIFVDSSELVSLSICSVPISVLDVSKTGPIEKIHLQNIPLCELHTNNACLYSCTLEADLSVKVTHNNLQSLLHSIGSCVMLNYITLKRIECSDHHDKCPGVDLSFGKNSELIRLTIDSVPVRVLDISQAGKVEKLQLQYITLYELHTNTEYVNACTLKADMLIKLTQNTFKQLMSSIGRGKMFEELTIHKTNFSDVTQIPSDVPLKMCQNSQLRKLTLRCLAFGTLDLSQTSQIEEIQLSSMFINELYINTDHLQMFHLESTPLSHKCIQEVFSTIESAELIKQLKVRYIWCLDHQDRCPGVEINLSRNYDLQTLTLSNIPIVALQLPKPNQLHTFLLNVPYNEIESFRTNYLQKVSFCDDPLPELDTSELDINNACVRKCDLVSLSHNSIFNLFTAIGSCAMLEILALKQIFCSDHFKSCPGVELKFCQDSQLQNLTVYSVPVSVLDLLQASRQMMIKLQNIHISEVHTNSEWLHLEAVLSVELPHTTIHHLLCSIGSCMVLKKLTLAKIKCSDHSESCPGVQMSFHQNCKLNYLAICRVPISELDLSQAGEVKTMRLKNIPLREIHANSEFLTLSTLEADLSNKLPHVAVEQFLSFVGKKCVMLIDITLKNIECSDHPESCFDVPLTFCKYSQPHVPLTFCKNSQPQQFNLYEDPYEDPFRKFHFSQGNQVKKINLQNLPLCAIHTYIECLQPSTLRVDLSVKLPHATIQTLFSFIGSCTMLSAIKLKHVQCLDHLDNCPGVPLIFCKNSNLQQPFQLHANYSEIHLENIPLKEIDLSKACNLKRLQLKNVKLPLSSWRVLFSSLRNLPLLNQVYLYKITMSASDWKELLTLVFTGTLAQSICLSVESCAEPSPEQWENIATELKPLSVTAQFWGDTHIFNKSPKEH